MMKKRFGLLVNSQAGKVRSKLYERKFFEELFGDQGMICEMQSPEEISKVLRSWTDKVECLFVFGGDGTYQKIFTEMMNLELSFPYVVPLKGGTVNMLVKDLHLGYSYKKVAKQCVEMHRQGKLPKSKLQKPVLRIWADSWKQPICGFYLANGSLYRVIQKYNRDSSSLYNLLSIFGQGLWDPFSRNPYLIDYTGFKVKLENDSFKKEIEGKFLCVMMSTLQRVLFGLRPFVGEDGNVYPDENPEKIAENGTKENHFHFVAYDFERKKLPWYMFLSLAGIIPKEMQKHSFFTSCMILERSAGFELETMQDEGKEKTKEKTKEKIKELKTKELKTKEKINEKIKEEGLVLDGELYSYQGKLRVEVSSDFVLNIPILSFL